MHQKGITDGGDKATLDFSKKVENTSLNMPFDGKRPVFLPADNSVSRILDAAAAIATVCDDSAYYITISIAISSDLQAAAGMIIWLFP